MLPSLRPGSGATYEYSDTNAHPDTNEYTDRCASNQHADTDSDRRATHQYTDTNGYSHSHSNPDTDSDSADEYADLDPGTRHADRYANDDADGRADQYTNGGTDGGAYRNASLHNDGLHGVHAVARLRRRR